MRKSTGPRIDSCSAPVDTHADWGNVFSKLTKKDVFIRGSIYLRSNQFSECLEKPIACNVCNRMSWLIVSKNFCKSIKFMAVIKHL